MHETPELNVVCGSPENPSLTPPSMLVSDTMPLEEAAEHLEMPRLPDLPKNSAQKNVGDNAYYFYQGILVGTLSSKCL